MKLSKEPPQGYIEYIRKSALSVTQAVGIEAGSRILEEGLKAWPDQLDQAIKWVVEEMKEAKT